MRVTYRGEEIIMQPESDFDQKTISRLVETCGSVVGYGRHALYPSEWLHVSLGTPMKSDPSTHSEDIGMLLISAQDSGIDVVEMLANHVAMVVDSESSSSDEAGMSDDMIESLASTVEAYIRKKIESVRCLNDTLGQGEGDE